MANVISGQHEVVQEFVKALGLNPKDIAEMHIHIVPDDAVNIEIIQFVYDTELKEMGRIVKKYHLTAKEVIGPTQEQIDNLSKLG